MIRPNDIPESIWNLLPENLKSTFSLNANRSFINDIIYDINKELVNCKTLTRKINTRSGELRDLTIKYLVNVDQNAYVDMSIAQDELIDQGNLLLVEILKVLQILQLILSDIDDRINNYKGALNGS
tara:strand:- start:110 stop:487 length:378 start_codon:yes stop_codon:yes gene_type:complete